MNQYQRVSTVAILALLSAFGSANVAFNDFSNDAGTGDRGYITGQGWTIGSSSGAEAACEFVSGASGSITDLILPVNLVQGSGDFDVSVFSDNGGSVGSNLIEAWTLNPTDGVFGTWQAPSVLAGDGTGSVVDGSTYWVVVSKASGASSDFWAAWNFNDADVNGTGSYNYGSGWNNQGNTTIPTFRMDVSPTPGPVAALPFALGLLRRRRRLKASP